jgi:hypothetical protein
MEDKTPASCIHWTAKVSCGFSGCTTLIFLIELIYQLVHPPFLPLSYIFYLLINFLYLVLTFIHFPIILSPFIYLYFIAFIFACIAMKISFKPQWRMGRGMSIISAILPGIILALYGALTVYLLFFWHPHFVW